jgi:small subunit ribosomal protein S34
VFELAKTLPNHGIGSTFTKHSWRANADAYPETYWTLTRIAPRPTGRSGKAWGILTWKGRTRLQEERVNGSVKTIWAVKEVARDADAAARPGPRICPPAASTEATE